MSEDSQNNANGDSIEQPQDTQVFEVNGEQVSLDELQKGYMRQSDYTRKTQDLAQQRQQVQTPEVSGNAEGDEERTNAIAFLKESGFVTQQDMQKKQRMDGLMNATPELAGNRKAIEALAKAEGKAPEDIIVDYGFMDKAKLDAAKSRSNAMGMPTPKEQPMQKSVGDMSPKEYAAWKSTLDMGDGKWS